jgi:tRNA pseudouridine38/39 synthase
MTNKWTPCNPNRRISRVEAVPHLAANAANQTPWDMCVLTISGKAFLWHQIRCIVAVLFRVASGREDPDIVTELLDTEANPRRPQYSMASEIPLNLFECDYDEHNLVWNYEPDASSYSLRQFQDLWTDSAVKATMLRSCIDVLTVRAVKASAIAEPLVKQAEGLYGALKSKSYIPLRKMVTCPSLDEKLCSAPIVKRRKKNSE